MEHRVIFKEKTSDYGVVALVQRGIKMKEYAVVLFYDQESGTWGCTHSYHDYEYNGTATARQADVLLAQLEEYNAVVSGTHYIKRMRLEELATLLKDGLVADDPDAAATYFDEVCEMSDEEKEWFGICTEADACFTPRQIQTERGLVYVERTFQTVEEAMEAGYAYSFSSDIGKLYSRITSDDGLCRAFAIVKGEC